MMTSAKAQASAIWKERQDNELTYSSTSSWLTTSLADLHGYIKLPHFF
jgi:hypothetical protein